MRAIGRLVTLGLALVLAATPAVATAQQPGTRALETGEDLRKVVLVTLLAVAAVVLVATLGYLYRRQRQLAWEFQKPDPPADDAEH